MIIEVFGLKNCDTCKKAMKAMESAGRDVSFIDIRAEADLETLLPIWSKAVGADALINRRSTTWRNLDEAERAADPNDLLRQHPTLIKRPVIQYDSTVHIGWSPEVEAALSA